MYNIYRFRSTYTCCCHNTPLTYIHVNENINRSYSLQVIACLPLVIWKRVLILWHHQPSRRGIEAMLLKCFSCTKKPAIQPAPEFMY